MDVRESCCCPETSPPAPPLLTSDLSPRNSSIMRLLRPGFLPPSARSWPSSPTFKAKRDEGAEEVEGAEVEVVGCASDFQAAQNKEVIELVD